MDPRCLPGSKRFWTEGSTSLSAEHREAAPCQVAPLQAAPLPRGRVIWEDVWVGYILSQLRDERSQTRVVAIHFEDDLVHDEWGFKSKPSALLWHSRVDRELPARMNRLHHWAKRHACPPLPTAATRKKATRIRETKLGLRCLRLRTLNRTSHAKYTALSCAGQPWLVCHQHRNNLFGNDCSSGLVDLSGAA